MSRFKLILLGTLLSGALWSCHQTHNIDLEVAPISLIPQPLSLMVDSGLFVFDQEVRILVQDSAQEQLANNFLKYFAAIGSWTPQVVKDPQTAELIFTTNSDLPNEAYALDVTPDGINIQASGKAGWLYGIQTLLQLFPSDFFSKGVLNRTAWAVPAVHIEDAPAFPWRGFMLDVSRHWFNKEEVKAVLDIMAGLKLNRFHWHLTDDQGWRIEIEDYPKLTEIGAWRVDHINYDENISNWWGRAVQQPGDVADYGGFYTKKDIKEIILYAKDRNIEIIPEIDMPGHAQATIAAYPEIGCVNAAPYVATGGVFKNNTYNPGKELTFEFVKDVLEEVMALFPYDYIHIGGDECNKEQWKLDPHAQQRIREEGLKDEQELQSYFVKRVEEIINAGGKKMIGWDEILEGGLAPNATVMSWRGEEGGIIAAESGHDVIMTPAKYCYLDLKQGPDDQEPNLGYSRMLLSEAYNYQLIPENFSSEQAAKVIGTQANLWTESITDWGKLTYMTFPRLFAIAENAWTPEERQDWDEFFPRLQGQLKRLDAMEVRYATSAFDVNIQHKGVPEGIELTLTSEVNHLDYYYTLDGTDPDTTTFKYQSPFVVREGMEIKAQAFKDKESLGKITHFEFPIHLGGNTEVKYHSPYLDYKDAAGVQALVDFNYGALTVTSDNWQGFNNDLEVDFNFPEPTTTQEIQITCLRMTISGIYVPETIQVWGSRNGKSYELLAESNDLKVSHTQGRNKVTIKMPFESTEVQALKVKILPVAPIPTGHHRAGEPSRFYIDEVVIL